MPQWYVHTHGGERHGPIEREELDQWVAAGRVTAECQVWMEGWPEWRQAPEVFPELKSSEPAQPQQTAGDALSGGQAPAGPAGSPFAGTPQPGQPQPVYAGGGGAMLPDRSVTVFVLGLIGILLCQILCIPAWIMGSSDLKEIDAGRRDPSGRGMTLAGMILGIVGSIMLIISVLGVCLWFAFFGAIVGGLA